MCIHRRRVYPAVGHRLSRLTLRCWLLCLGLHAAAVSAWDSRLLTHPVVIDGLAVEYPVFALYHLPGTRLSVSAAGGLELLDGPPGGAVPGPLSVLVVPARSGWHRYRLGNTATGEELLLNLYSLVPYQALDARGYLGAYRVGHYPVERLRNLEIYDPPAGFLRLTEPDAGTAVSPNFTVGQFPSKQAGAYPKYLALRPTLLVQLERILRALNEAGHDIDSLHVMSGYRTPFYNRSIGNTQYSRHVWGGAADIFVDVNPRDGYMDDLNRDGAVNRQDAEWLANFIEELSRAGKLVTPGGIGIYGSTAAHGPFVHVDVRGYQARW